MATSGGVLIGMMPVTAAGCMGVWVIVFFATRYVSLASLPRRPLRCRYYDGLLVTRVVAWVALLLLRGGGGRAGGVAASGEYRAAAERD